MTETEIITIKRFIENETEVFIKQLVNSTSTDHLAVSGLSVSKDFSDKFQSITVNVETLVNSPKTETGIHKPNEFKHD